MEQVTEFLSKINDQIGTSLIAVASVIVLIRILIEMVKGADFSGGSQFGAVLKDFIIFVLLVKNFDLCYEIVRDLPSLFSDIVNNGEKSYEESFKQFFKDTSKKTFLFFEIDYSTLVSIRSIFLGIGSFIYKLLIIFVMSFFAVLAFARIMLKVKTVSNILISLVLFAACYPLMFAVLDSIILYGVKAANDSFVIAVSISALGGASYIYFPYLLLTFLYSNSPNILSKVKSMATRPIRDLGKTKKVASSIVEKRPGSKAKYEKDRKEQAYIKAKKDKDKTLNYINDEYKKKNINPNSALAREEVKFKQKWGQYEANKGKESKVESKSTSQEHNNTKNSNKYKDHKSDEVNSKINLNKLNSKVGPKGSDQTNVQSRVKASKSIVNNNRSHANSYMSSNKSIKNTINKKTSKINQKSIKNSSNVNFKKEVKDDRYRPKESL